MGHAFETTLYFISIATRCSPTDCATFLTFHEVKYGLSTDCFPVVIVCMLLLLMILPAQEELPTYERLREVVTAELEIVLTHADWDAWFRVEIDREFQEACP
jgi:hypothetical protein